MVRNENAVIAELLIKADRVLRGRLRAPADRRGMAVRFIFVNHSAPSRLPSEQVLPTQIPVFLCVSADPFVVCRRLRKAHPFQEQPSHDGCLEGRRSDQLRP